MGSPRPTPRSGWDDRWPDDVVQGARTQLAAALEDRLQDLAAQAATAIVTEIPGFRTLADSWTRDHVQADALKQYRLILTSFTLRRAPTRDDLVFMRSTASQHVGKIPICDLMQAFHICQQAMCDAALDLSTDGASRDAAFVLGSHLMRHFAVTATHVAEIYLEAELAIAQARERLRRDLLDELLAGRYPAVGPLLDAAQTAGLDARSRCLVIAAVPVSPPDDERALPEAAAALGQALNGWAQPLTVVRRQEIVVVAPVADEDAHAIATALEQAQRALAGDGVTLAVGVSTIHDLPEHLPAAYREAVGACDRLLPEPGVSALITSSAFDYLTGRADATTHRLVSPDVARFVADDIRHGAVLIQTLREYAAADLVTRTTAKRLGIHVNTVSYRLNKIAARTGCQMRRLCDVIELLITVRLIEDEIRRADLSRTGGSADSAGSCGGLAPR